MATDWNKMTINQLRTELTKRGLDKTGPKSELVKRLTESDNKKDDVNKEEDKESKTIVAKESLFDSSKVHEETEAEDKTGTEEKGTEKSNEVPKTDTENKEAMDVDEQPTDDKENKDVLKSEEQPSNDNAEAGQEDEQAQTDKEEKTEDGSKKDENEQKAAKPETKKKTKGQKKWVAIMDNEKSDVILEELEKINKLECLKGRSREIFQVHETHKIRLFPIVPSDLAEPLILDALKQSISSMAKFNCSDPQNEPKGLLEVTFPKRSKLEEFLPKLSEYKESVNVIVDKKESEWKDQYKQAADVPEHASDLEKLRLFAPSLPQSITEDDMWDYFPKAKEILLINATPRKHAYITFVSEESMLQSVEELNARGPQKDDFKFCRLLRLSDVVKLIPRRGVRRALKRPVKRSTGDASADHKTGQSVTAVKPQKVIGQTKSKAFRPSGTNRARELLQKRRARGDKSVHKTSYWRAPSQRTSGRALENAFSQLQQPTSLVNAQAQQGLNVLDTILNTLGQIGGNSQVGGAGTTVRPADNRPAPVRMQQRQRYASSGQKRVHSPNGTGQDFSFRNKRQRRRYGRQDDRHQDNLPRNNYVGQGRLYDNMMSVGGGASGMNYTQTDNQSYGRPNDMGGNRMYNTLDSVNRMRDSIEPRQNMYGMSGPDYRQDPYY